MVHSCDPWIDGLERNRVLPWCRVVHQVVASWSTGAAPVSSGSWVSTNFAGTEDPLDEGDRWYPLPGYSGFKKQDGLAIGETADHNITAVWSITPPAKQYSQVTLGPAGSGGGGPIVRIDRNAHGQTGWLLLLWANDPTLSGIYKLSADATGGPIFTPVRHFTPTIVTGDSWRLTADGNTLEVSLNGVSQFTYTTDGTYASGDVGFHTYTQAFAFAGFEGGDVAGGADTTPPTAPTNLTARAASASQINLAWTASTDNVAVTGYLVERCQGAGCSNFAQIATATGTAYNNTALTDGTSYSYRVRAQDAAGNQSPNSNVASASTPDTTPPTAPSNLTATTASSSQVNLSWTASTDNVGVTGYQVERCQYAGCTNFAQVATVTGTTYTSTGLTADTVYRFRVRATDAASNLSPYSNVASASTDVTPPAAPGALAAVPASSSQINLVWTAATDNVGIASYLVERCLGLACTNFVQVATVAGTTYNDTGLAGSTLYSYRVRATDPAGNVGPYSNTATATTLGLGL